MKVLNLLLAILLFSFFLNCKDQENTEDVKLSGNEEVLYINAKKGLNLREEPSTKSKVVTAFPYKTKVYVLEKTGNFENYNGEKAEWFKIKSGKNVGYVFSKFLTENLDSTDNEEPSPEETDDSFRPLTELDVKKTEFEVSGKYFNFGINCTGSTHSEYSQHLEFKDKNIAVRHVMNSFDAPPENEESEMPCMGFEDSISTGTYVLKGGSLKISFTKLKIYHDGCGKKKELVKEEEINEISEYQLVTCKGKQGFGEGNMKDNIPGEFYILK
ncbi:MAG: SH3 domain-containing protein [Leptospiraceae bacterium]|nr:SH3 domain-containing protein [Leptospiraceae bacterium]